MFYSGIGGANTKCPFFIRESELQITCEGIIQEANTINKFPTEKQKIEFQVQQCFKYPNECPLARLNEEKYKK